ncbi:helix-turn-helix domain-containing protein [Streptomyces sp. NEAU-H3]|nr:helix-turn-helix domain-containing protein [Streptomyces sp. NEAU-H3]
MEVHFRTQAGVTQAELARALNVERSLVSKFESGDRVPDLKHAEDADAFLDAGGALVELWKETDWYPDVQHPDWFERRAEMDAEAMTIMEYSADSIPGLLQVSDYAQALFARAGLNDEEQDERVRARLSRQMSFLESEGPVLIVVIAESCLRTVVGSYEVMASQCGHLLEVGGRPNVWIQVIPEDSPATVRPKMSMSIISLPDGKTWVYSESLDMGHFSEDPKSIARHSRRYHAARAGALSASDSATLIREMMERYGGNDSPRRQPGAVVQEQLQRGRRRQLHRNRVRVPRPRPRS